MTPRYSRRASSHSVTKHGVKSWIKNHPGKTAGISAATLAALAGGIYGGRKLHNWRKNRATEVAMFGRRRRRSRRRRSRRRRSRRRRSRRRRSRRRRSRRSRRRRSRR